MTGIYRLIGLKIKEKKQKMLEQLGQVPVRAVTHDDKPLIKLSDAKKVIKDA